MHLREWIIVAQAHFFEANSLAWTPHPKNEGILTQTLGTSAAASLNLSIGPLLPKADLPYLLNLSHSQTGQRLAARAG